MDAGIVRELNRLITALEASAGSEPDRAVDRAVALLRAAREELEMSALVHGSEAGEGAENVAATD